MEYKVTMGHSHNVTKWQCNKVAMELKVTMGFNVKVDHNSQGDKITMENKVTLGHKVTVMKNHNETE